MSGDAVYKYKFTKNNSVGVQAILYAIITYKRHTALYVFIIGTCVFMIIYYCVCENGQLILEHYCIFVTVNIFSLLYDFDRICFFLVIITNSKIFYKYRNLKNIFIYLFMIYSDSSSSDEDLFILNKFVRKS